MTYSLLDLALADLTFDQLLKKLSRCFPEILAKVVVP